MSQSETTGRSIAFPLFAISFFGLFLELLFIRWIGTEIRIFAYLQNTVLVACFFGLGLGCMTADKEIRLRDMAKAIAILLLFMSIPIFRITFSGISEMLSLLSDFVIWAPQPAVSRWHTIKYVSLGLVLTLVLLILILEAFVPVGRLLGRLMNAHGDTVTAYSINVVGSLLGVWAFTALSFLQQPPFIWYAITALMLGWFMYRARKVHGASAAGVFDFVLVGAIAVLGYTATMQPGSIEATWSPYQKLVLRDSQSMQKAEGTTLPGISGEPDLDEGLLGRYTIKVNNSNYQEMMNLSAANIDAHPEKFPADLRGLSQYDIPLLIKPNPLEVLIVGAGSGNDVAGALRGGAAHVTAVEIDPVIFDMGRRFHEERPYDSPKVEVVIDDARSYFATTKKKFDLIIFGLLDSHTMASMMNTRLDHFVYTRESIEMAKGLLTEDGVMALSFMVAKPFIGERIFKTLRDVFGVDPVSLAVPKSNYGRGCYLFLAGNRSTITGAFDKNPNLTAKAREWEKFSMLRSDSPVPIATDDWPYLYLEGPGIPHLYYLLAGLLGLLLLYASRRFGLEAVRREWSWHFFLLGAAFLLLEVQNISKAAVVLGTTWLVSAVIISAVLAMVLIANFLVTAIKRRELEYLAYALLGLLCVALYQVDLARFAGMPYTQKALLVGLVTTIPMVFSGIIFTRSFVAAASKSGALGANLVGALVGGLLQSVTFIVGIKALLLIVLALYIGAFLTRPSKTC